MSIINDALKKTQNQFEKEQNHPLPKKETSHIFLWVATVIISIGFLGSVSALIYITTQKIPFKATTIAIKEEVLNKEVQPEEKPFPLTSPQKTPLPTPEEQLILEDLTLNGIITMGKDRIALINNQIYREGDLVGNNRIIHISLEKVEIDSNGEIVTLTTSRH